MPFGLIWVAIDLLVQVNELIGTYSWIAYRIGGLPQLVQPVSVGDTPALNLLLHAVNAAIALAVLALLDQRRPHLADVPVPRRVLAWSLGVPAAVCVAWVAWSLLIFTSVTHRMGLRRGWPRCNRAGQRDTGHLISPGICPGRRGERRDPPRSPELSDMTRQAAARGARIVVWPGGDPELRPAGHLDTMDSPALVRQTGVYLAMGFTPNATDGSAPTPRCCGPRTAAWHRSTTKPNVFRRGWSFTPGTAYPTVETPVRHGGDHHLLRHRLPRRPGPPGGRQRRADDPRAEHRLPNRWPTSAARRPIAPSRIGWRWSTDVAWDSVIVAPNGG